MADGDIKIKDLSAALQIDDNAEFVYTQDNGGTNTTFKAPLNQIARKVAEGTTYTNLETTAKTLVGAINELSHLGNPIIIGTTAPTSSQGANGNIYIQYTAGTGGADDTVDGMFIKINGAWCEIQTGGGGGASAFADLTDVDIDSSTLANGQVPVYNSATQKWENMNQSGGSGDTVRFDINASHIVNPTQYDIVVFVGETEVYSHSYSCTVYGEFSKTTDTFIYGNESYTIIAQGYKANQGQKMLDVSINGATKSVYCSETNSSYSCNDDFFITVNSGGHTILNNEGTSLTQRTNLQFKGAYSEDNSTDDTTEVNVVRSMTRAEFDLLSADEKTGLINITDEISGGLKYVKETLYSNIDESNWTAQSSGATLTLTDNILDYDEVYFESAFWEGTNTTGKKLTHFVTSMVDHNTIQIAYDKSGSATYDGMFDVCPVLLSLGQLYTFGLSMQVPTTTSLKIQSKYVGGWDSNKWGITRIIGIKYLSDSEHTYSTDEQIVGTWIDGKTLYERTLVLRENGVDKYTFTGSMYDGGLYAVGLTGIDKIWLDGLYSKRGKSGDTDYTDIDNNSTEVVTAFKHSDGSFYFKDTHEPVDIILNIRYTKSV